MRPEPQRGLGLPPGPGALPEARARLRLQVLQVRAPRLSFTCCTHWDYQRGPLPHGLSVNAPARVGGGGSPRGVGAAPVAPAQRPGGPSVTQSRVGAGGRQLDPGSLGQWGPRPPKGGSPPPIVSSDPLPRPLPGRGPAQATIAAAASPEPPVPPEPPREAPPGDRHKAAPVEPGPPQPPPRSTRRSRGPAPVSRRRPPSPPSSPALPCLCRRRRRAEAPHPPARSEPPGHTPSTNRPGRAQKRQTAARDRPAGLRIG
ncbi:basic proline-rich protein-like [Sarcophilus harrisii]|uniref:basic proline-rich protein-like n=1 Tax=Sarcophilus harrisii TaxID=9305 RepID=UPI001301E3E3|nr:basic proline-rich protein-like [Sarcophilus harrisii]